MVFSFIEYICSMLWDENETETDALNREYKRFIENYEKQQNKTEQNKKAKNDIMGYF